MSKQSNLKKNSKISGIIEVSQKLFTTPETKGKEDDTTSTTPSIPKMNILFSKISDAKAGYNGGLEFLNKHDEFDKIIGKNPVLLPPNLTSLDSSTTATLMLNFSELCRLDVHLHTCREFLC